MEKVRSFKHLYRSDSNKVFAGICGGIGEYWNIDPVVLRLIWLLVTIFTGIVPGVVAYILAIFVVPPQPPVGLHSPSSHMHT